LRLLPEYGDFGAQFNDLRAQFVDGVDWIVFSARGFGCQREERYADNEGKTEQDFLFHGDLAF